VFSGALANDVRFQLARDSLSIAHDYPLFGTGPGTFIFVHPRYQGDAFAYKAEYTHNDYLNCLDDYGLAGFALALFFVAAVTLKFFRPLVVDNRWQDRVLVATGFAAWAALVVHSLFDFNLHIPANALLLFSLTGLALGRINDEKKSHWSTVPLTPLGRWLGGVVIVLALIYGALVVPTALSDRAYEQTFAREDVVPFRDSIEGAQDALRYDPGNEPALALLGDLHRAESSSKKENEDRLSEGLQALGAYQKALQANALDDSVEAKIGMTLDIMQKYPEALSHYQMALSAQPYNAQFWYWLGNHYTDSGEADKAQDAYEQAERYAHGSEGSAPSEKQLRDVPVKEEAQPASSAVNPARTPLETSVSPH
jgi:tetratricopeptide (TPR) repeat protein